jgi:DNA (cytosine-5)-methyltransferase 1
MAGGIGSVNCSQYTIKTRVKLDSPCPTVQTHGNLKTFNELSLPTESVPARISRDTGKPPYRVPNMSEIAAVPWNGLTVASTFSGCGGSCLGYRMAGFRVAWANEFVPAAQDSYRANAPGSFLDTRDIRQVQPEEILAQLGIKAGDLDLLDGSPPCQAFSTAGKREKGWGEVKTYDHGASQCNETLFTEYIRLLRGLKPRVFVAENVSGLVKGVAKGYFLEILAALKASGYRVACRVCDAQWLGVPQQRQRTIFIGVREDLNLDPVHPKALTYRYSVRDALPWISEIRQTGVFNEPDWVTSPAMTLPAMTSQGMGAKRSANITVLEYRRGTVRQNSKWKPHNRVFDGSEPCGTIICGDANKDYWKVGPEKRKFTIAELKRICAFPDDFILTGSYAQQWERLGNSVPPVMMMHIASAIRDGIFKAA